MTGTNSGFARLNAARRPDSAAAARCGNTIVSGAHAVRARPPVRGPVRQSDRHAALVKDEVRPFSARQRELATVGVFDQGAVRPRVVVAPP